MTVQIKVRAIPNQAVVSIRLGNQIRSASKEYGRAFFRIVELIFLILIGNDGLLATSLQDIVS